MRNILENRAVMEAEKGNGNGVVQKVADVTKGVRGKLDTTLDIVGIGDKPEPPKKDVTRWGGDGSFDVV